MTPNEAAISGIVLAGGQARRLGGQDKGLIDLAGQPLIGHVLQRLRPQVREVLISANRNAGRYAAFGHPVIADGEADFPGPLAGVLAAGQAARHEWLLVCPCDTPFLPADLATRLMHGARSGNSPIARAADTAHTHFTVMLLHRSLLPDLAEFLATGQRRVEAWQARHRPQTVTFSAPGAFANINTLEDLQAAAQRLGHGLA